MRSLTHGGARQKDFSRLVTESSAAITAALMKLFESHRDALRVPPSTAVAAFRGLVFASAHPMLRPQDRLGGADVVGILMSGIARNKD
jgi:hypothetical protein